MTEPASEDYSPLPDPMGEALSPKQSRQQPILNTSTASTDKQQSASVPAPTTDESVGQLRQSLQQQLQVNPPPAKPITKLESPRILTNTKGVASTSQSPITPIQSATGSNSSGTPLRNPSVSFGDLESQERIRRFTISAQPSATNVMQENAPHSQQPQAPQQQQQQQQQASQPVSNVPSRNTSVKTNTSTNNVLSFLVNSHAPSPSKSYPNPHLHQLQTGGLTKDSAMSPITPGVGDTPVEAGYMSRVFSFEQKPEAIRVASPSPPPSASPAVPIKINGTNSNNSSRRSSIKKSNKTIVASPVGPPVPFQQYLTKQDDGKFHILLACTGSVATIKMPQIIDKLFQIFTTNKVSIQLVLTKSASHFLRGLKIHNDVKIWRDEDEWANFNEPSSTITPSTSTSNLNPKKPKNPYDRLILHNELRRWADIMLIAPLSANTLAKISNGIADNLLTSIVRSWSPSISGQAVKKPIIVAPAMNTFMYTHPITAKQINIITCPDFGIEVLKPVEKVLVCGDIGMGGMREWTEVVDILRRKIIAIKAEKKKQGDLLEEDENNDEEDEEDENEDDENEDDEDEEDDEDDDDDDEDDEDDEDEDDDDEDDEDDDEQRNENIDNNQMSTQRSSPNDKINDDDDDEILFEITTDDQDESQPNDNHDFHSLRPTDSVNSHHHQQKITIPKETQNII